LDTLRKNLEKEAQALKEQKEWYDQLSKEGIEGLRESKQKLI
jgi:hypothetical protein